MLTLFITIALQIFAPISAQEKQPIFTPDSLVMDYGTIECGTDGTRELYFTNTGDAPLIITRMVSSCGCLVPEYPKDPILPGGRNKVRGRYDTNRQGPFHKTMTITTNEMDSTGNYKSHVIHVKGLVKPSSVQETPTK